MAVYAFFDNVIRYYQTIQYNGVNQPQETILNFISSSALTVTDDPANSRTNITISPKLDSLASLATTGVVVYTGSNTYQTRTITGTTNQITVTNGDGVAGNPTIAISATYPGQTSISTLGTILLGTWNGNIIAPQYGGTGVNNGTSTISVGGNFTTSGAFPLTFNLSGATTLNLPTTGTLIADPTTAKGDILVRSATGLTRLGVGADSTVLTADSTQALGVKWAAGGVATPAYATIQDEGVSLTQRSILNFVGTSVTAADDAGNSRTNVTFATALNQIASGTWAGATSITTLGTITTGAWNGSLIPLAYGGTNANLTANNGGIFYSTATAAAILAGTSTANQVLLSGANSAPSWSTATYPPTTTVNQILYSSATNTVTGLATANNGVLVTSGAGVPSISSTLPNAVQDNITRTGTITNGTWQATTIGTVYGGTGLNSYAQGDILYSSATNTLAALPKNTSATRYLANTGTNNNPAWSQVDLTNGVTGALPIANGGTGQTTKAAAYDALSPNTTQGDITYRNATTNVRLPAGTAGQFLQTQGPGANPIWATAGVANIQNFTASGTWNKPSSGTWAFIQAWGAGASGGSNFGTNRGSGGGGGSYVSAWIKLSLLGSTETVTIGAGGASVTSNGSSTLVGNNGGNSTFGSWVTAYGGGAGGFNQNAGSGAGQGAQGVLGASGGRGVTTNTVCAGGAAGATGGDGSIDSGGGAATTAGGVGGKAYYGGGGGGSGGATNGGAGGTSFYGGGGGGGSSSTTVAAGGVSLYGGSGGGGSTTSASALNGSQPGGGGGGATNALTSGAGGDGQIVIIVI